MLDLHCHSRCSDGTLSPSQIAEKGRNFAALSLTDHDCCDGIAEFMAASAGAEGVRLPGIEISVQPEVEGAVFHMLIYGMQIDDPGLLTMLDEVREGREERNRRILKRLAELGIVIDEAEVRSFAGGEIVARPHIARALMARSLASSVKDAFERYLGKRGPAYVSRHRPSAREAIEVAHRAGGVAVMAHPRFYSVNEAELRRELARLKELGLDGIEAMYLANSMEETRLHLRIARELGLLVTAGSDFHGSNRPDTPLGVECGDEEELIGRLLEKIEYWQGEKERGER